MNSEKLILIDDLHLEGRDSEEIKQLSHQLNESILEIKKNNDIPILVCAGDISEGINGIEWVSQFNIKTIYVSGNHEFWNQDFFETHDNLKNFSLQNPNIHYLNNETITINNIRFIGTTLWTNLANFLAWDEVNNMIKFFPAMGDFKKTTAKQWFTSQNIQRLASFLLKANVEKEKIQTLIDNKLFNPLLELEENHKAVDFLLQTLSTPFDGKTIVVTHHLPNYDIWLKVKGLNKKHLSAEFLNDEKGFMLSARNNDLEAKDLLMMAYYVKVF